MKCLLIAEAANPEWASVPLEGWSHSRAVASITDAHIVTQVRNRDAFLRAGVPDREFTAIDSERIAAPVHKLSNLLRRNRGKAWTIATALRSLTYWHFERLVWRAFGKRIRAGEFDVVHQITPLSPTTPSRISKKCHQAGVPFVLGPLNGGVPWPRWFDKERRRESEWLSYIRGVHRLLPGYRSTRRCASAILVGSRATFEQMPKRYHHKCIYVPENAYDPDRFEATLDKPEVPPLRVAFLGRLVPYKGCDMLLRAVAPLARDGRAVVEVIGDGPERATLSSIVQEERIADAVTFHGWVPQSQVHDRLRHCHVLGFPSIREFGGAVVVEAMACGLVPVVVDYGGPGEIVSERTGFRVPIGDRASIVAGVRQAMTELLESPDRHPTMAQAAQERVRSCFTWDRKAEQVLEVYRWVTGVRTDKPDFGMPLRDSEESPVLHS